MCFNFLLSKLSNELFNIENFYTYKKYYKITFSRSSSAKLGVLGSRDLFQDGRQIYSLILSYEFSIKESACDVFAVFPSLAHYLYEHEFNCMLFMIFSSKKQFLHAGGAYPYRVKPGFCWKLFGNWQNRMYYLPTVFVQLQTRRLCSATAITSWE